jgi:hypothetical protein
VEAAVSERAAVCDRLLEQLAEPAPSVALGRLLTLAAAVLLRAGDRVRARALLRVAEGALREVGDVAAAADAAQLALDASEAPG